MAEEDGVVRLGLLVESATNNQRTASVVLPATVVAPRWARQFAADTLRDWGAIGLIERFELIVSELVTNAIRHGGGVSLLMLISDSGCLRIEVVDYGGGSAVRRRPRPEDIGGRGLLLVESMTDRWGAAHDGRANTVWCEISRVTASTITVGGDRHRIAATVREPSRGGCRRPV